VAEVVAQHPFSLEQVVVEAVVQHRFSPELAEEVVAQPLLWLVPEVEEVLLPLLLVR
jgi:hypothetical protein